jgi:hypothetical protein
LLTLSKQLTSAGKIPHDVELQKHPEKSLEGRSWLMGDVSAMIKVSAGAGGVAYGSGGDKWLTRAGRPAGQKDHRRYD